MNKTQLVKALSQKTGLSKAECAKCFNAFLEVCLNTLLRGEPIIINGFGKFFSKFKQARNGINPQTKDTMVYSSKYVPSFRASQALRAKFV